MYFLNIVADDKEEEYDLVVIIDAHGTYWGSPVHRVTDVESLHRQYLRHRLFTSNRRVFVFQMVPSSETFYLFYLV